MRTLIAFAALAVTGCSVDVGAGSIAPVLVDEPVDPTDQSPPISFDEDFEFLSADQSSAIADQYGSKLGAVDHVDVEVQELTLEANDVPLSGSTLIFSFEGITVERAGDRVRLPTATKQKLLTAIKQRQALTVPVHVTLGWPMPPAASTLIAHAKLQPVVVVNALQAL